MPVALRGGRGRLLAPGFWWYYLRGTGNRIRQNPLKEDIAMRKRILLLSAMGFVLLIPAALWAGEEKTKDTQKPPPYTGLKKRIAVVPIEMQVTVQVTGAEGEQTTVKESTDRGPGSLGSNMTEQLTTALINTGRFIVLERKALSDIKDEQALGKSGQVNPVTAPTTGQLIGAEWLVKAAITEYESKASRSGGLLGFHGFGIGGKKARAKVVLDVRIIDSTTGEVVDSVKASGDAKSSGALGAIAVRGVVLAGGKEDNTPIGQATRTALQNAVQFICDRMEKIQWRGRIVSIDGQDIIINSGARSNVRVGDTFDIYKLGKKLIDPDTGQVLGQRETKGGRIQVTEVQEKLSICSLISGSTPNEGDVVRKAE
jgi:curli biogenesis system outer membrane secretion channel CsgG